jgi:hypothetical protein
MTNLTQAGSKIKGMRIVGENKKVSVDDLVAGTEYNNDAKLRELGLSRDEKIMGGFDIVIDLEQPTSATTDGSVNK